MKSLRTMSILLTLLCLLSGILSLSPARTAQAGAESAPPAGLSADDWSQIENLLAAALPSQQAYLKASNTGSYDYFGSSVAISGDTLVVGAEAEDSNATGVNGNQNDNSLYNPGAAYVFVRSGGIWSQQAYLKASNTGVGDNFGVSVAIDGDTVVVGAPAEASNATGVNGDQSNNSAANSGAAYVFTRSGTTWSQQAYLKASNTGADDYFGRWVAIDGDTVVVSASGEDSNATGVNGDQSNNSALSSGAAYVFTRSGTTWSQQAYLKASNTAANDFFSSSAVAIDGDTVIVVANGEDSNATGVDGDQSNNSAANSGAAYVFTRSGTTWSQQAYLKASNTGANDRFGGSVAISGDTVTVGASGEASNATGVNGDQSNNSAANSGAAYVFLRSGTNWSQQAYLKASNTEADDYFGISVAISGDTVLVGAEYEDSSAIGVNGDQSDNSAQTSGAVYVFTRSETTWTQQAYLKASNTGVGDEFGEAVAISGDMVIIGAAREDSNASGVNGNQSDNSADESGAAYVYLPNNEPTDINLSNSSVAENQSAGAVVGTLSTTDPDAGDTHTYSFACSTPGADDASFQVSGNSLQTSAVFNYETKNSYAICIRTDDGKGGKHDKNFNISVTDANDAPTDISISDSSLAENQPIGTTIGSLTTTDEDAGDTTVYSLTCSSPGADDASFQTSGASGHVLQNMVVFDYETKNSYEVCVHADDGNGGAYDKNFTITVTDVNEAPTNISLSNNSVAENQPIGTTVGILTTTDPDASNTHTYSFCGGTDDASFSIAGTALKTAAVFDFETKNVYNICTRTDDGNGGIFDKNFTINVTNVNETLTANFRSVGTNDGWILESTETSNAGGTLDSAATTFNLGDGAQDKQYRSILSFNTATLPDTAVITKVTLKIRKQGLVGTNPFAILSGLKVDMRKPYFGTKIDLLASDFQAAAGRVGVATFGATPVNNWYSAILNTAGRNYISKTGTTQFRLYFATDDNNDNGADYMKFFSGNYATVSARPTIIIEYYIP